MDMIGHKAVGEYLHPAILLIVSEKAQIGPVIKGLKKDRLLIRSPLSDMVGKTRLNASVC